MNEDEFNDYIIQGSGSFHVHSMFLFLSTKYTQSGNSRTVD